MQNSSLLSPVHTNITIKYSTTTIITKIISYLSREKTISVEDHIQYKPRTSRAQQLAVIAFNRVQNVLGAVRKMRFYRTERRNRRGVAMPRTNSSTIWVVRWLCLCLCWWRYFDVGFIGQRADRETCCVPSFAFRLILHNENHNIISKS